MKTIPKVSGGNLFMGHMTEFAENSLTALDRWTAEGGDVCEVRFGPVNQYVVTDAEIAQHVLVKNNKNYQREKFTNLQIRKALPKDAQDHLFSSDGAAWLRRRRLMQPAFHRKVIASFGEVINEEASKLFQQWDAAAANNTRVELEHDLGDTTLEITMRTMFSTAAADKVAALKVATNYASREVGERLNNPFVGQTTFLPTARNRRFNREVNTIREAILEIIADRAQSDANTNDLLDMLLMAKEDDVEQFTQAEIVAEMTGMVFAGHDTTTAALMWALYVLAENPEWLTKVQAEVDTVLNGAEPRIDQVGELPLVTRVIKETLRLYPPAWVMTRQAIGPDQLGDYEMAKPKIVLLNVQGLHKKADYWEAPETFNPDRFIDEKSIPKGAYIPFGNGPRKCIGEQLAMTELQLLLARIVQRYDFKVTNDVETNPLFVLRAKDGILVELRMRNS